MKVDIIVDTFFNENQQFRMEGSVEEIFERRERIFEKTDLKHK